MVLGKGSTTATLTTEEIQELLASADEEILSLEQAKTTIRKERCYATCMEG